MFSKQIPSLWSLEEWDVFSASLFNTYKGKLPWQGQVHYEVRTSLLYYLLFGMLLCYFLFNEYIHWNEHILIVWGGLLLVAWTSFHFFCLLLFLWMLFSFFFIYLMHVMGMTMTGLVIHIKLHKAKAASNEFMDHLVI